VRAYNGQRSRWYQAAKRRKAGRGWSLSLPDDGSLLRAVDGPLNDRIDDAYRTKYRNSPYVVAMISARARSATVRVALPRAEPITLGQKGEET
jgi:hypothetical protein